MPQTKTKILVCNAGSSSLKFSLFDAEEEVLLAEGGIDWIKKPTRLVFRRTGEEEHQIDFFPKIAPPLLVGNVLDPIEVRHRGVVE